MVKQVCLQARLARLAAGICTFLAFALTAFSQTVSDPLAGLDAATTAAESALRAGEPQLAESYYRTALLQGWMMAGTLDVTERRLPGAHDAFRRASTAAVEAGGAWRALALVSLQEGSAAEAVTILARLVSHNPKDIPTRRLLAQALGASGRPQEAVHELEEAYGHAPDDLEVAFALASSYLQAKKPDAAERLFARIATTRPIPQTYVLIGRAYRDAGAYDRARASLATALKKDPRVPYAHYYLGTLALRPDGVLDLDKAIAEFRRELTVSPSDPITNLRLGMALVEARRDADAGRPLELATEAASAPAVAFYYLGRNQIALNRQAEAVVTLRRALERSEDARAGRIHNQLGMALRSTGALDEAARHFAEAERSSTAGSATERQRVAQDLSDAPDPGAASASVTAAIELPQAALVAGLRPAERLEIRRRVTTALARTYLNLGIMQAQAGRYTRAAELLEEAAHVDAAFPQVQYSLGVAYFNAQRYTQAVAPLARARDVDPDNAVLRRTLAIACLNTDAYDTAAALLASDRERDADPSLQYAYGLALVRSDHAADAEAIFSRLLADHANMPELSVVLGHAYAQQGDYPAAIDALRRALQLKHDVADANSALGVIYLKQGKLPEAEAALRAELTTRPDDVNARETLATVLDLLGRQEDALSELRMVLKARPELAAARYLRGKILLSRGAPADAATQLEIAARLTPEDANIHYQLARAYEQLGRTDLARQELATYQQLKERRRAKTP